MFRNFGAAEIILILVLVLLLFGAKRLPDAARGLGRSLRIFKSEVGAMNDDTPETSDEGKKAPPIESPQESASGDPKDR